MLLEGSNLRTLLCMMLLVSLIGSLFVCYSQIAVQAATVPPSIIGSDTVWTQAGSPYNLSGPVLVNPGVTLTIEAGATVNIETFYLQVNGSLQILGSSTNPVHINSAQQNAGQIRYLNSTSWDESTGIGCIISNAIINQTIISINGCSLKITGNTFNDGAGMMADNVAIGTISGASTITDNRFRACGLIIRDNSIVSNNIIEGGMGLYGGAPAVSGNTVSGGSSYFYIGRDWDRDYNTIAIRQSTPTVSDNTITGNILAGGLSQTITHNYISGTISSGSGPTVISYNTLTGNIIDSGNQTTISHNLIVNGTIGIQTSDATIQDNTIFNCQTAIILESATSPTITGNNILGTSQYNIKLVDTPNNISAANNWWGTTDLATINQSIYDLKNDFNLGKVEFTPILTSANPDAPAPIVLVSPSVEPSLSATSPTATPTATPTVPEFSLIVILILLTLVAPVIIYGTKRQRD